MHGGTGRAAAPVREDGAAFSMSGARSRAAAGAGPARGGRDGKGVSGRSAPQGNWAAPYRSMTLQPATASRMSSGSGSPARIRASTRENSCSE